MSGAEPRGWHLLTALGRVMYRWRVLVLVLWAVTVVGGGVIGGQIFDRASSVESLSPGAESERTQHLLDERVGDGPEVVAIARGRHPRDPQLVRSLVAVAEELHAIDGVVEVRDGVTAPGGSIGADNNSVAVRVALRLDLPDADQERLEEEVAAVLRGIDAPTVLVSGEKLAERAFADQAIRDAAVGESIALVALFVALIVILGGVVAGVLPLLVALGAIAAALLGLVGLTAVTPVSEFAVNVVTLLGIGLAVDYTIVLMYRFGEERAAEPDAGTVGVDRSHHGDRGACRADLRSRRHVGDGRAVGVRRAAVGVDRAGGCDRGAAGDGGRGHRGAGVARCVPPQVAGRRRHHLGQADRAGCSRCVRREAAAGGGRWDARAAGRVRPTPSRAGGGCDCRWTARAGAAGSHDQPRQLRRAGAADLDGGQAGRTR